MVVCKFYLQGTCKFGNSCKFDHQLTTGNYGSNSSILIQNTSKPPQTAATIDTNTLVKSVVNDMTSAERGGQWLLSSYAPFKEKPGFPGFEDHSMEEIRYLFYEAVKTQAIEQYKQNLQMMLQQAVMRIKTLQNPSPDAITILKQIYDTQPSSASNNNNFGGNTQNSVFGGTQGQSTIFGGGQPPQKSVFGGGNQSQGLFAQQGNPPQQQQSIFGQTNSNSIFGGAQNSSNSIFGGVNQTSSIFGGSTPQSGNAMLPTAAPNASSIFGGGNSIFGVTQSTQQSVFAQPTNVTQPPNPFQQASNNIFATPQNLTTNTPFATVQNTMQPAPTGLFGPATAQPGTFQQQHQVPNVPVVVAQPSVQSKPAFQHTQSIFGNLGLQNTASNSFGSVIEEKPNEEFYSKREDLTEEEIKWFESDDLDIMKIPEKPPTYEMCFKV